MSDSAHLFDFGKFVPGFDFLQQLTADSKGVAHAIPGLGGWLAPTVNVEELDKRIAELKAVLFWLEHNGTALKATIQALEVQKMTLTTLAGMNLSMAEVARAFTLPATPAPAAGPSAAGHWPFAAAPAPQPAPAPVAAPADQPAPPVAADAPPTDPARQRKPATAPPPASTGLADPVQWWSALTQQFQQIAAHALRDAAPPAAATVGEDAPDSIASSARRTGAEGQKVTEKMAAAKHPAKKTARKTVASVARKAPVKKAAKKAATKKPVAKKPARPAAAPTDGGWPLPPPFKFGR